jgi:hypothetical protein
VDTAQLRAYLAGCAAPVTYAQAARVLGGIQINILTQILEKMMEEDMLDDRPFLAARVVSRTAPLPARGFFDMARALGRQIDDPSAFHAAELAALRNLP